MGVVVIETVPESDYDKINWGVFGVNSDETDGLTPTYVRSGIEYVQRFLESQGKTLYDIAGYHIASNGVPVFFHGRSLVDALLLDGYEGIMYNKFKENNELVCL